MIWTDMSSVMHEDHSFRILSRTPMRSFRLAKSASMKLKLGINIELTLISEYITNTSLCLWHGMRHFKFHASTLVSGFHYEP